MASRISAYDRSRPVFAPVVPSSTTSGFSTEMVNPCEVELYATASLDGTLKVARKKGKRTLVITLASAPGHAGRTYRVRLSDASGRPVASGTLKGRALTLTERKGSKVLDQHLDVDPRDGACARASPHSP